MDEGLETMTDSKPAGVAWGDYTRELEEMAHFFLKTGPLVLHVNDRKKEKEKRSHNSFNGIPVMYGEIFFTRDGSPKKEYCHSCGL